MGLWVNCGFMVWVRKVEMDSFDRLHGNRFKSIQFVMHRRYDCRGEVTFQSAAVFDSKINNEYILINYCYRNRKIIREQGYNKKERGWVNCIFKVWV